MTVHEFFSDVGDSSVYPVVNAVADDNSDWLRIPMNHIGNGKFAVHFELPDWIDYSVHVDVYEDEKLTKRSIKFSGAEIKVGRSRAIIPSLDCACSRCLEAAEL
jgi:hypothetical protein